MRTHSITDMRRDASPGYPHLLGNPGGILGNPGNILGNPGNILGNPAMMVPFGHQFMPFANFPYFHPGHGMYPSHPMFAALPRGIPENEERELDLRKYSDKGSAKKRETTDVDNYDDISESGKTPAKKRRESSSPVEENGRFEGQNQMMEEDDDEDYEDSNFDEESVYSFDERNERPENNKTFSEHSHRRLSFGSEARQMEGVESERKVKDVDAEEFSDSDSNNDEFEEREFKEKGINGKGDKEEVRLSHDHERMHMVRDYEGRNNPEVQCDPRESHETITEDDDNENTSSRKDVSDGRSAELGLVSPRRSSEEHVLPPYTDAPEDKDTSKGSYSSPLMAMEERVNSIQSMPTNAAAARSSECRDRGERLGSKDKHRSVFHSEEKEMELEHDSDDGCNSDRCPSPIQSKSKPQEGSPKLV